MVDGNEEGTGVGDAVSVGEGIGDDVGPAVGVGEAVGDGDAEGIGVGDTGGDGNAVGDGAGDGARSRTSKLPERTGSLLNSLPSTRTMEVTDAAYRPASISVSSSTVNGDWKSSSKYAQVFATL